MPKPLRGLPQLSPHAWKGLLVAGICAGGLWTATHGVAGVSWGAVGGLLHGVSAARLGVLAAVWLAGLAVYSLVLSAAMPGLGVRRGLLLNLSGSAVANVVPLGGAVATAVNWRMVRAWGHSDRAFVAFFVLTNSLDVVSKLLLPVVAAAVLVGLSLHVPLTLWLLSAGCSAALLAGLAVSAVLGRSGTTGTRPHSRVVAAAGRYLQDSGSRVRGLLTRHWRQLLPASAAYVAMQVLLLTLCLRAVGLDAPVTVVLTAAAIERIGSLVALTPGGTGVAEVGAIGWLVAAGLDTVPAVAGVLLYRVFLIALEIPLGGVLLGGWEWAHRGLGTRSPLGGTA